MLDLGIAVPAFGAIKIPRPAVMLQNKKSF
jgi:hypothetical protein